MHWPRAILHIDMDAFYASIEQHDNPDYKNKPLIVAGPASQRGVVSAASYEIRPYGVHSAMPTAKALKLCPHAILVRPRMHRYREVSETIFGVFHKYTPAVQSISLDEAFLDVTASQRLHGDPVDIARKIRRDIKEATGLTASVGVATCRFVAKIASDLDKPDGLTIVPGHEMLDRLGPLPVGKIWGVGPVTNRRLEKLGIKTIADLRAWPRDALHAELGNSGDDLWRLAHCIDDSEVVPDDESEDKSISHEETFATDITDAATLNAVLREHADRVATRMRNKGLTGKVVFIKVRYHDFSTVTRRVTLAAPTALAELIYRHGAALMHERTEAGKRPVRLLGIGMAGLGEKQDVQASLFSDSPATEETPPPDDLTRLGRLEETTDAIRAKLGKNAIQRASVKFRNDE